MFNWFKPVFEFEDGFFYFFFFQVFIYKEFKMNISKTKNYNNLIPLSDIKRHLRIDESSSDYDQELRSLATVALTDVENFAQFDIVPTVSLIEDDCVFGYNYQLDEPNIILSGITAQTINSTNNQVISTRIIDVVDCRIIKGNQYTIVKFPTSIQADRLFIQYSSGSSTLKQNIKQAALLRIAYYFDADRQGAAVQQHYNTKAFERLLTNESNLL